MTRLTDTRWLTAEEQRAWRAYLEATNLLFDVLERQLQQDAGIPHTYYEVLVRLSESDDRSMRMSELAERTRSSRSRLSHAVARLEEKGWIERRDCDTDRRGQIAHLTDVGFTALAEAAPGHVAAVRTHMIAQLTPDQIGQLEEIGQAIINGLDPAALPRACPA